MKVKWTNTRCVWKLQKRSKMFVWPCDTLFLCSFRSSLLQFSQEAAVRSTSWLWVRTRCSAGKNWTCSSGIHCCCLSSVFRISHFGGWTTITSFLFRLFLYVHGCVYHHSSCRNKDGAISPSVNERMSQCFFSWTELWVCSPSQPVHPAGSTPDNTIVGKHLAFGCCVPPLLDLPLDQFLLRLVQNQGWQTGSAASVDQSADHLFENMIRI